MGKVKKWDKLVGCTIMGVMEMGKGSMRNLGWDGENAPICIALSTGAVIFASRDEEMNGPGEMFYHELGKGCDLMYIPSKKGRLIHE